MEVRTGMIKLRSATCHSTCKDSLSVTRYCFPVVGLFARSATSFVGGYAHPEPFSFFPLMSPRFATDCVGGYAHPELFARSELTLPGCAYA